MIENIDNEEVPQCWVEFNALWAPHTALRATYSLKSPRALRGCMVLRTKSGIRPAKRLRR